MRFSLLTCLALGTAAVASAIPRSTQAQSITPITRQTTVPSDVVAYLGMIHTPVGMFLPSVSLTSTAVESHWGLSGRYGQIAKGARNNRMTAYAAGVERSGSSSGTLSAIIGQYRGQCPDPECSNKLMLGAGLAHDLARAGALALGLAGDIGWSEQEFSISYLAGRLVAPISVSLPTIGGFHVTPQLAPGLAWSRLTIHGTASESFSGTRAFVGGSVAVASPGDAVSLQLDASRMLVDEGKMALGISLTVRPK